MDFLKGFRAAQWAAAVSVFLVLLAALVVVHSLGKRDTADATAGLSQWAKASSPEQDVASSKSQSMSAALSKSPNSEPLNSGRVGAENNPDSLSEASIPILGESESLAFYDEVDDIAEGSLDSDTAARARLLEIVENQSAPEEARQYALELALELTTDADFEELSHLLSDSTQPTEILEMVYFDLHGRDQPTILRNLLPLAEDSQHPFSTESRATIEFLTDAEIAGKPSDLAPLIEAHIIQQQDAMQVIDSGKNVPVDDAESPLSIPIPNP